ncbi:MAG: ABC transporter substrate-binding protein [Desulfovibrio sp.]
MKVVILFICIWVLSVKASCGAGVVHVYNWTEYIPETVIEKFTKETDIQVQYSTYDSNEALYTKLKLLGGHGYDVIVPSSYYIAKMRRDILLQPLQHSLIPNIRHVVPDLMNRSYDPENMYSVPYLWGGTGLGYLKSQMSSSEVQSWDVLWSSENVGKILLQDDMREVFSVALMRLGYSINETNVIKIREAYELVKLLFNNTGVVNSDSPREYFVAEDVNVGMLWNGEAFMAQNESTNVGFSWPREGAILWVDCLAIPANAKNVENAHVFINFLMRPDVAKEIAEAIGYSTPNKAAMKMLAHDFGDNHVSNPPLDVLQKSEYQKDVGSALALYEKLWEELKTGEY